MGLQLAIARRARPAYGLGLMVGLTPTSLPDAFFHLSFYPCFLTPFLLAVLPVPEERLPAEAGCFSLFLIPYVQITINPYICQEKKPPSHKPSLLV